MKKFLMGLAVIAAGTIASAANAALVINPIIAGPNGTFTASFTGTVSDTVGSTFSDSATIVLPGGMTNGTISTTISPGAGNSSVDLTSVLFNSTAFVLVDIGPNAEFGILTNAPTNNGINTLTVNGTVTGSGTYSGTLFFAPGAIPEPSTWAFMIVGFGAVGYSMRRKASTRLVQAV
jgi:hypothetical protein